MNEREEIAGNLRRLKHETYYAEETVDNICDVIGVADPMNTFREPEDIYVLLADLIEPKAKIMVDRNSKLGDDYRFCGNCKHVLPNTLFNDYEITHCPYCGCLLEEPY